MISFFLTLTRMLKGLLHAFKEKDFQVIFTLVVLLLLSGTIFYHNAEGLSILDALYFCVTTLTTVGHAGFIPQTNEGKIFTMIYIFAGAGLTFSVVGRIAIGIYLSQRDRSK